MSYHVLVVDDIPINRKLIKSIISSVPDVIFMDAGDGFEALQVLAEYDIDLVILDLMMPSKDGFETLADMKKDEKLREIPVIVYSAVDGLEGISRAFELGAYDYFIKPLTPQQMEVVVPMKVKNALESHERKRTILQLNEKVNLELALARSFQQLLMKERMVLSNAFMFGRYIPCNEIGGDFYDCVEMQDNTWFVIADVSGHGVASAMISSMIKVEFNNSIKTCKTPTEVLRRMNETFCQIVQGEYYLTAFVAVLRRDGVLQYSNAGHPYSLLYRSDAGEVEVLKRNGFVVGMFESAVYELHELKVQSGDMLFMYTDGLLGNHFPHEGQGVYDKLSHYFLREKEQLFLAPLVFFNGFLSLFRCEVGDVTRDDVAMMTVVIR